GDQEDEHSCFSDNTHRDLVVNMKGISNVFFGRYKQLRGDSLYALLKDEDEELAEELENAIFETAELIDHIPSPIDREVLATAKGSAGRATMEEAITSLQKQA